MALSIADQIALDDALVAPADRLKIGKCNLRLSSDITSKEATLQVVYDVLKLTPFYKAFQVTADAPEIYMQEFWASAYVHNRSVRFKMNNKKHIIGLEQFRDILQICPKVGNKKFVDPPLESEIIIFLASLGHSGDIRKLSDVNVNKLHQPWRSFAAVINKCLCGTPSYDSLRLSQAQILWGMYNKKSVDYAYLLWEDFIFKIETKSSKKGSAMYYPRFTKIVVNYVMEKDPSIPRRNKVNWHYARDDPMFTTINVISRNEVTQLYGAILPVALTNEDIRNSESYKEYYAMASGTIPPKTKGSKKKANTDALPKRKPSTAPKKQKTGTRKHKSSELENISEADLTEAEQLKIVIKRSRQETHSSHASGSGADEGTGVKPGVPDAPEMMEDDDEHDNDEQVQDDDEHDVWIETVSCPTFESDERHLQEFELCWNILLGGVLQSQQRKIRLDQTPEGRQYPHDLRQPLPLVLNSQGRHVIPFHHFINNDLNTYVGKKRKTVYAFATSGNQLVTSIQKDEKDHSFKEGVFHRLSIQDIEDMPSSRQDPMIQPEPEELPRESTISVEVLRFEGVTRHANARNDVRGSRPVRGQDAAPAIRECTFAGFMKCNPTAFHGADEEEISKEASHGSRIRHTDSPIQPVAPPSPSLQIREEYKDDERGMCPVDYPMDGGDDGDDDDDDSSRDDADDKDEGDEDEDEEHLAPADSAIIVPVDEPVFPPEGTKPIIPPPSTDITIGARINVRLRLHIPSTRGIGWETFRP
ncbi:hypothetical protein Tco_0316236 [Tanacetum coccineum]